MSNSHIPSPSLSLSQRIILAQFEVESAHKAAEFARSAWWEANERHQGLVAFQAEQAADVAEREAGRPSHTLTPGSILNDR